MKSEIFSRKDCESSPRVRIVGGLGNQLFQYAFARWLSDQSGKNVEIDDSLVWLYHVHPYVLPEYVEHLPSARSWSIGPVPSLFLSKLLMFIFDRVQLIFNWRCTYLENASARQQASLNKLFYVGYFQKLSYVLYQRNRLRVALKPVVEMSSEDALIRSSMRNNFSVSVHIRRGDYISSPSINQKHGVCPLDYYIKASKLMADLLEREHSSCPLFYVFSDDISWAKRNLDFLGNVIFISSTDRSVVHEHYLMRSCAHHIIANSTFSWWAAFLSDVDGFVIYPSMWFGDDRENPDLFLDDWYGI